MTTEGSLRLGPEQQAAVQGTLARISALHKAPNLEVEELLGQFEQLDLLGVTGHPAIAAALKAEGQIPEVANRVRSDLETERFQRLGVLLGVEEPLVVVPEAEDGEMAGLRKEAKGLADQAIQRGLAPREVYERFVPAEDLFMLSLSQLEARAATLTREQLLEIPPYKLSKLIMGGNLTVRQVADLHPDPEADRLIDYYSQAAPARWDIRKLLDEDIKTGKIPLKDLLRMTLASLRAAYGVAARGFPRQLNDTVTPAAVREGMTTLGKQWQEYEKRTGKFLVGGLIRMREGPPAVSKSEIARTGRLMVDVGFTAMATYEYQIEADKLLARENTLAGRDSLELAPDDLEYLENNLAKDPDAFPRLSRYVREIREKEATRSTAGAPETPAERPTLDSLVVQLRTLFQEAHGFAVPESQYRPLMQAFEFQIADELRPELTAVALDLRNEEEIGRLLENKDWGIANVVRQLHNPDFAQTLFPDSPELQVRYQILVGTHGTGKDLQDFLEVVSKQVGRDREEKYALDGRTSALARDFYDRLLDPAVSAADLANTYVEYQKTKLANRRFGNEYIRGTFGFLVAAIQRAGLPLHPSVDRAIQELKDAGIEIPYLEPAGEPEVEKRVVEVSPIDLLRAGYSPVVGELKEMLESITSEQAASLVRSYPWTALEFNESLPATPEVRGTIIRWLMGLTPDRIEPYLRQNPLSVLNMAGWMLERHDLQPVTRNMITNTIAYLSPDTIARELSKKPMAVFDMKAETAFGPYLTVPSANSIKTHMRSITLAQVRKYFEASPKAILGFDAGMMPYYTPEVQAVIKEEAGKITYART